MRIQDGWVFRIRPQKVSVEISSKELVLCKHCIYRDTDDCKWRDDESPDDDDFCSIGERCDE